jgi:two-component system, LytTR family, sensor kinase
MPKQPGTGTVRADSTELSQFRDGTPAVRIDWRIAIGVAAALAILFASQNSGAVFGIRQSFSTRLTAQALQWGIWLLLLPLIFTIAERAHRYRLIDWRNVTFQVAACLAVALLHSAILSASRWLIGMGQKTTYPQLLGAFVTLNFSSNVLRYGFIAATYHAIAYHREVRRRDVMQARMAQAVAEARLENLEARLQPHFLFNALNAVAALIRKNPPAASVLVGQLSELLRAALSTEAGREVTLADELRLLDQYMAIQRARFSDRLTFAVDVASETLAGYVPQMILQPMVENAVRHGIGPREAPGTVRVEASRLDGRLRLVVRDDGVGYGNAPPALHGNGVGLRSTRARLEHLYGGAAAFDIRATSPDGGTVVTIEIPFHTTAARTVRGVA